MPFEDIVKMEFFFVSVGNIFILFSSPPTYSNFQVSFNIESSDRRLEILLQEKNFAREGRQHRSAASQRNFFQWLTACRGKMLKNNIVTCRQRKKLRKADKLLVTSQKQSKADGRLWEKFPSFCWLLVLAFLIEFRADALVSRMLLTRAFVTS